MVLCDCPVGAPIGPTLAATCGGGSFMLFMGLLEVFLRSQCDLEDPCGRTKVNSINKPMQIWLLISDFYFWFPKYRHEQNRKQNMIL